MMPIAPDQVPRFGLSISLLAIGWVSLLVACGGSGTASSTDAYGESNPQVVTSSSFTVEMKGIQFVPQGISVRVGTTVTWVNHDQVAHNVRQIESEFLSPDSIAPGQTFAYTFTRAGTFRYQCTFHHPLMNGTVIVTADG
jgi:plastocyanin